MQIADNLACFCLSFPAASGGGLIGISSRQTSSQTSARLASQAGLQKMAQPCFVQSWQKKKRCNLDRFLDDRVGGEWWWRQSRRNGTNQKEIMINSQSKISSNHRHQIIMLFSWQCRKHLWMFLFFLHDNRCLGRLGRTCPIFSKSLFTVMAALGWKWSSTFK